MRNQEQDGMGFLWELGNQDYKAGRQGAPAKGSLYHPKGGVFFFFLAEWVELGKELDALVVYAYRFLSISFLPPPIRLCA